MVLFALPVAPDSGLPDALFYLAGALVGAAGGALQASSRSLLVTQADAGRMTAAVGLYELGLLWATFAVLLFIDRRFDRVPAGLMVSSAFALYFTGRLVVEVFKAPLVFADAPVSIGQRSSAKRLQSGT